MRRLPRRALIATLPLLAGPGAARAAEPPYPPAPVALIVPFSAGGAADIAAHLVARHAPRHLPNPAAALQVENRPGASGAVGTLAVAKAKPDGQTLLLARELIAWGASRETLCADNLARARAMSVTA